MSEDDDEKWVNNINFIIFFSSDIHTGEEDRTNTQQSDETSELQRLGQGVSIPDLYLAEEIINVRIEEQEILPEDEDFMRDFDRIVSESMQVIFFIVIKIYKL